MLAHETSSTELHESLGMNLVLTVICKYSSKCHDIVEQIFTRIGDNYCLLKYVDNN